MLKLGLKWLGRGFVLLREKGGLGIKKLEIWNQASMMVHIWNLFAKACSIWVAWVETVWLRGKSFWQVPIPQTCSWSWRKIFKIGTGSRIFMWYDSWHPAGCLIEKYGLELLMMQDITLDPCYLLL
jgi:hypothetical protein